jgi:ABC-2 type transport system permease protein
VALILAALGLPLFMVAGFSWPSEAIPPAIRMVSYLVPSTSAITGFVKLSQLGAPLAAANSELLTLCALAVFYNLIALLLMARKTRAIDPTVSESALIETGHSTQ